MKSFLIILSTFLICEAIPPHHHHHHHNYNTGGGYNHYNPRYRCPHNEYYSSCGKPDKTCDNYLDDEIWNNDESDDECYLGCFCCGNLVRNDYGSCVHTTYCEPKKKKCPHKNHSDEEDNFKTSTEAVTLLPNRTASSSTSQATASITSQLTTTQILTSPSTTTSQTSSMSTTISSWSTSPTTTPSSPLTTTQTSSSKAEITSTISTVPSTSKDPTSTTVSNPTTSQISSNSTSAPTTLSSNVTTSTQTAAPESPTEPPVKNWLVKM